MAGSVSGDDYNPTVYYNAIVQFSKKLARGWLPQRQVLAAGRREMV